MKMFDVYPRYDIYPVRGLGSWIWDKEGQKYLDFYGGHAVISIGHSHPHYVDRIQHQMKQLGFYSNLIQKPKFSFNKLGYSQYLNVIYIYRTLIKGNP